METEILLGAARCGLVTWLLVTAAARSAPRLVPGGSTAPSERFLRTLLVAVLAAIGSVALLGAAGFLNAGALTLVAAALWVAARWLGEPTQRRAAWFSGRRRWVLWPALAAVALLAVDTVVFLPAPPVSWDAITYHLYFPARWLQEGRIFHIPTPFSDNSAAFAPQNGALFFAWQMALLGRDALCNWSQILCLAFVAVTVYRTCRWLGIRRRPAVMAGATLCWLAPLRDWTYTANVDVFLIAFWLGAVCWLVGYLRRPELGTLVACGLATGLAAGTKTVGLPLAAFPAAVMALVLLRRRRWAELAAFGAAITAGGGFWYLLNGWRYGNPLFPLDFSLAGLRLPGAYGAEAIRRGMFHCESVGEWVDKVIVSYGWTTCALLVVGLAALVGPVLRGLRRRPPRLTGDSRTALLLLAFAVFWIGFYSEVIPHNNQTRFFIPVLVVSVFGWALILDRVGRVRRGAETGLFVAGLLAAAVADRPEVRWGNVLERLAAADVDLVRWGALAVLTGGVVVWAARSRRRWAALAAWVLFWATVAVAAMHGDRSRSAFLAHADFNFWQPGYLIFNDPQMAPRRIAYSGANIPYAMMGPGWRHYVVYCNTQGRNRDGFYDFWIRNPRRYETYKPGIYRGHDDFERWLAHLRENRIDTVVLLMTLRTERPPGWQAPEDFPIERLWVREHPELFEPVLLTGVAEIHALRLSLPSSASGQKPP